jgi:hypothetical protein
MSPIRTIATVLGFASLSAFGTLAVVSPSTTFADPVVQITAEGTKIDNVLLTGKVERDARAKTGWVMVVTAENKSDKPETCTVTADLQRTVSSPMSRVGPRPQMVWQEKQTLDLAAHEKLTKRIEIAAAVAKQLTDSAAAEANKPTGQAAMMAVRTFYSVRFGAAQA